MKIYAKVGSQKLLTKVKRNICEQELRTKLIDFASLIELELDFSEEDVEFADREQFETLLTAIQEELEKLIQSFIPYKIGVYVEKF